METNQLAEPIASEAGNEERTGASQRPLRIMRRGFATSLVIYSAAVLFMWAFQDRFVYPGHSFQGQQWTKLSPAANRELIAIKTARGDSIDLLFERAVDPFGRPISIQAGDRPTILFFYGGGGTIAASLDLLSRWRAMGANVATIDYPGYGMSGGVSSEAAFYAAADAAYDYLIQRRDVDRAKIIVAGQSLGTGVAVDLASRRSIAALALFSPYTSLIAMAHVEYPWLPTSLMIHSYFRSDQKIASVTAPILIVHGEHDRTIPIQMSRDLANAAIKAKVTTLFVDADHNDLFDRASAQMDAAMRNLINRVMFAPTK